MLPLALGAFAVVAATISSAGLLVFGRLDMIDPAARLGAIALMVSTSVTIAGLMVGRSRWARRHAWMIAGVALTISVLSRPIDLWWIVSSALAVAAAGALGLRSVTHWLATVERRTPVPTTAVVVLLLLLDAPLLVAALHPDALPGQAVAAAIAGWALMWAYSRAWVPALWILRFAVPLLAVGWAWQAASWGWVAAASAGLVAWWAAWTDGALLAVQPLEPRRVTGHPLLAEMVPDEVRTVAGIDERGRPQ